jgi:hypothetical protein
MLFHIVSYIPDLTLHVILSDGTVLDEIIRILFESYLNAPTKNFGAV